MNALTWVRARSRDIFGVRPAGGNNPILNRTNNRTNNRTFPSGLVAEVAAHARNFRATETDKKPAFASANGPTGPKRAQSGPTWDQMALNGLRAAGNVAGFMAHYWKPIALIALALLIMGVLRGCHFPFVGDIGKSRGEIILERDLATRGAEIAAKFGDARVEIIRRFDNTASSIERDLATGADELETLRNGETLLFLSAWASADRRLCNNAGPCGTPGA